MTKKGGGITTRVFASLIMQVILFGRADAGCLTSAGAVGAILTLSGFEFCRVPEEPRTPIYITVYPGVFSMATASSCCEDPIFLPPPLPHNDLKPHRALVPSRVH